MDRRVVCDRIFQSTPSAWRETLDNSLLWLRRFYFNPLPPHGGRLRLRHEKEHWNRISIHSLRMEGDLYNFTSPDVPGNFNPLPPHGGRRSWNFRIPLRFSFQSTPSAWRETEAITIKTDAENDFNPLPPHGGRPYWYTSTAFCSLFQSTPSAWRETDVQA